MIANTQSIKMSFIGAGVTFYDLITVYLYKFHIMSESTETEVTGLSLSREGSGAAVGMGLS